jgi:hypothetical protein
MLEKQKGETDFEWELRREEFWKAIDPKKKYKIGSMDVFELASDGHADPVLSGQTILELYNMDTYYPGIPELCEEALDENN